MAVDAARAKSLFLTASDLSAAERAAYLDQQCGGDADLRARVEALLRANDAAPLPPASAPEATVDSLDGPTPTEDHGDRTARVGAILAGKYKLVEAIGEGGMGSVFMAQQTEPVKRAVAVKVIKAGMDSKAVLARFEAERQALAMMDHPNIAKVLDAGTTDGGRPFFVMELVKGVPITQYCDESKLTPRQRLELFVPVCQAIQHAHQKGIIHRDIKPSNVLIAMYDDRAVPKVIDFGVAKAAGQSLTDKTLMTGMGAVVGTPEYMSPEQASLNNLDIDTRSDVYALGVLLYELLTGTTPVDKKSLGKAAFLEILRIVRDVEAPRPSAKLSTIDTLPSVAANRGTEPAKLSNLMKGELDWVVLKALEKDRTRRYDTANALSRDIQRYLADEVVEARPPSLGYRVSKFVRRHKGQVIAASLVLLALVGGIVGTTLGLIEARQQEEKARGETVEKEKARLAEAERVKERDNALRLEAKRVRERDDALKLAAQRVKERDAANDELKHRLGVSSMLLAAAAYDNRDVNLAAERLEKVPAEQHGWDWRYLKQQTRGGLFTLYGHRGPVTCVAFSPDGTRIVSGGGQQLQQAEVKVWDAQTGSPVVDLKGLPTLYGVNTPVKNVAISPDGTRIITGAENNMAIVCDARTGKVLLELKGHTTQVQCMAFSPDGTRIVTGGSGQPRSIGGGRIHGKQGPGEVKVWDARTGTALHELKGHTGSVDSVSFSPDGSRIATGGGDVGMPDETKVWDATTGKALLELNATSTFGNTVSFSPDGTRILVGNDASAKVVDAQTGKTLLELKGRPRRGTDGSSSTFGAVNGSFSPDGTRIVTAGGHYGDATVWDARTGTALLELTGNTGGVMSVAFSPDSTRIVTGDMNGTIKVWDARTGSGRLELAGYGFDVHSAAFSPDGTRIVTGSGEGAATVWDARTGMALFDLKGRKGAVNGVAFSRDGTRIVTGGGVNGAGEATVWDAQTGVAQLELKGLKDPVLSVAFSPDGTQIVTGAMVDIGGGGNELKVWDARTGKVLHDLTEPRARVFRIGARGWSVAFSLDGTRIVAGGGRNSKTLGDVVMVWDARSGKVLLELTTKKIAVQSVSFSPDGQRIVTGDADATATVWDAASGNLLLELKGHQGGVMSAAFSPDATRIVTGGVDQTIKVWDVRTGTTLVELKGHASAVKCVSFNRDGTRILSGGGEPGKPGQALVWDARPGTDPLEMKVAEGMAHNVIFSPDGTRIAATSNDGSVAIWDTQTGAVLHNLTGYKREAKIAFSPDGARIVAGDHTATKVWDTRTGKTLLELKKSQGTLTSVAYSPDGTRIVIGGYRNDAAKQSRPETAVWDAQTGEKLFELQGDADWVTRVSFSSDGARIVIDRHARPTKVWDARTGQELPGEAIPETEFNQRLSPDGRFLAQVHRNRIELISLKPAPEEIECRRLHMQPNFGRYREGYLTARAAKDDFAARFYLKLVPPADQKALVAKADVDALAPLASQAEEYLQAMKPELAVPLYIEMINVKKAALGPDDPSTLETMTQLGVVYWRMRQFDKSVPLFEELLKRRVAKHGRDHLESVRAIANLGVNYRDADKLKEAIPLLEEAQRATNKYPETANVTGELVKAYARAGENAKSINLLEEIVNDKKAKLGPDHLETLGAMTQLGVLYWQLRQLDKSVPLFEELLKRRVAKHGRDHLESVRATINLGVSYRDADMLKEAIPLLEEAQRATNKYPELAHVKGHLLQAYAMAGGDANVLQEKLDGMKAKLGPDHLDTLEAMSQLGGIYWRMRQLDKSVPLFEEALKGREAKLGRDHVQTLTDVANLGVNYRDAGRLAEAIPLLEEANRAAKKYPELRWVTNELFGAYLREEPTVNVKRWTALIPSLKADLGEDHSMTIVAINNLGYGLARCRNFTEAEPMLKDTIERELRALDKGKELPPQERTNLEMLLLQTRTNLGEMYQLQRNGKAAEDLLRKCLAEREKKEPNSFRLASTQSMLGRVLAEQKKFAEAESLLLAGYKGLKDNGNTTPDWGRYYLPDTLDWLTQLYEAWEKPEEAKKWRAEREKYPAPPKQPEKK